MAPAGSSPTENTRSDLQGGLEMAVILDAPLEWKTASGDAATMLDELQPNIVKAHVRDSLSVLFLRFGDQAEARTFWARSSRS
jgi:hypothetical protein